MVRIVPIGEKLLIKLEVNEAKKTEKHDSKSPASMI